MLTHRPVREADIPIICQFAQSEQELFPVSQGILSLDL